MRHLKVKYVLIILIFVIITASCIKDEMADQDMFNLGSLSIVTMIAIMVVGLSAIVGFFFLIYMLAKQYQERAMKMIDKGIYKPRPVNWQLLMLTVGCILIFIAPGVTLLLIGEESLLTGIGAGLLLFFGGIALLLARKLAIKYLPEKFDK